MTNMAGIRQGPIPFEVVESRRAADLFDAPRKERVWSGLIDSLLMGQAVFVAGMTRTQRESCRSIIRYRGYGTLISRSVIRDGQPGMILRLDRGRKGK